LTSPDLGASRTCTQTSGDLQGFRARLLRFLNAQNRHCYHS
jgi:hypothetical protein